MRGDPKARVRDREVLRIVLPALGTVAAEPAYVLVDTEIVDHLGAPRLGALALGLEGRSLGARFAP